MMLGSVAGARISGCDGPCAFPMSTDRSGDIEPWLDHLDCPVRRRPADPTGKEGDFIMTDLGIYGGVAGSPRRRSADGPGAGPSRSRRTRPSAPGELDLRVRAGRKVGISYGVAHPHLLGADRGGGGDPTSRCAAGAASPTPSTVEAAARAALSGEAATAPKGNDGTVEFAPHPRRQPARPHLRCGLEPLTTSQRAKRCARFRPGDLTSPRGHQAPHPRPPTPRPQQRDEPPRPTHRCRQPGAARRQR